MSSSFAVTARGLSKKFGDVLALDGIDLDVPEGIVFGLLGPNGAGKTTLTRILATLEHPSAGSATVLGLDVGRDAARVRTIIGYVPQELSADKYLSARENLAFFADLYHLDASSKQKRIEELIALLGLGEVADRQLRTFSGGMKKKLDLACGLLHRPRLLFLDEPSLGLDVQIRRAVWDHILELKRAGTTIFLCTNYMDEADVLADRVGIVNRGRLVAQGTPMELRAGLGGDVVTVELVAEAGVEAAERALSGLPGTRTSWREGRRLHVTVEANESVLPTLVGALHQARIDIAGVSYHRPGLEEVFLRHTGHRYADEQGTAGPPKARRG